MQLSHFFKSRIMKTHTLLFLAIILLASCRKSPDFDPLSSQFIVATDYDKTANFGAYKTFYISDTILYVGGAEDGSFVDGPTAQQLVKGVKDSLTARGYVYTGRNSNPDLGLTLSAVKNITVVIQSYPGWWGGWYGGCYYGCYGYYYPWTSVYSYTEGTVILAMYDLKNATSTETIRALWATTGLGALGSSSSTNVELGVQALQQGFKQSPYIVTQ
jgi:hypothetical protein